MELSAADLGKLDLLGSLLGAGHEPTEALAILARRQASGNEPPCKPAS